MLRLSQQMCIALGVLGTLAVQPNTFAAGPANWAQHLGPTADGQAGDAKLPSELGEGRDVKWKTPIPGTGWSSPVVWGSQVWMTTSLNDGRQRHAVCVDLATGRVLHDIKVFDVARPCEVHQLNSHASPTPAVEEGRVYVHFGTHGTAAIDTATGAVLWRRTDLTLEHQVGPGSSPVLHHDKLIFHCDGTDVQYIVALDKNTGANAWKVKRSTDIEAEPPHRRKAFATPIVITDNGRPLMVSIGSSAVYGYEPDTGAEVWRFDFDGYSNVANPVVHDGLVIFSTCYDKSSLVAFKLGGKGDVTRTHHAWTFDRNVMYKPTPALVGGRLYMIGDTGVLTCLDAATGAEVYKHRVGGNFSASPLVAGGLIYLFSQEGKVTVFRPGEAFDPVSEGQFDDGFMSSPAVVGATLILRTKTHLYRIHKNVQ